MVFVRGLLDRLLLVCAFVAGGLVPGFIAQYRQRLGGRLDQARLDLAPWQRLADQNYQGDIERLIRYHLESSDPTFHAEGGIIRALVTTVQQLQSAVDALHGSLFHQAAYLTVHGDPALAAATLHDWVPTFALSGEAIESLPWRTCSMQRLSTYSAMLAGALLAGVATAAELKSGPQPGDKIPGVFHPLNVTGSGAGQKRCLI